MMKVAIRTDASTHIGTGHVMRCLSLANVLRRHGCDVCFLTARREGHLHELIRGQGYESVLLDIPPNNWQADAELTCKAIERRGAGADWVVVDHYALDGRWESFVRSRGAASFIMVIDDLANRAHQCELLLDQNYVTDMDTRYAYLVPSTCVKLLGPRYLLLRDEFAAARPASIAKHRKELRRLLLFFGGSDPTNETAKALSAVERFVDSGLHVDVVVGQTNPNRRIIEERCSQHAELHYYCQINHLAQLMSRADLSIGAGGVTMWERCYLGLPSAVVIVADNQKQSVEAAAAQGAIRNLGWHESVTVTDIEDVIQEALTGELVLDNMSGAARALFGKQSTGCPGDEIVEAMAVLGRSKDQSR